ncbi:hypothetical protein QYE76_048313 [Lolium multiflorum]|uniref:Transposase (putative) gypsy type domain-containing protein n=1 Tax=Lolium multiflorum TaxID=4521 RepID=A0AAD8UXG2_LOLMU|nr:hypothetical protein QYE76_048313 [Lolium multiflorum]
MISTHWSFTRDSIVPKPEAGEIVMTKAWVERGLSLSCSDFYPRPQHIRAPPHNICPNSYLLLSNFALCEGHLGIRPDIRVWQFFFRVKKETKDKAMLNTLARTIIRVPVSGDAMEEVGRMMRKRSRQQGDPSTYEASPRQRFRSKPELSGEASAKKPKTRIRVPPPWTTSQEPITKYMKKSPAVGPATPIPPCLSPYSSATPPQADPSPPPAANTPPEIIPVSSRWAGKILRPKALLKKTRKNKAKERLKSLLPRRPEMALATSSLFRTLEIITSTPKAYATKFFNKLSEEKWELEQDLLNAMLNNVG